MPKGDKWILIDNEPTSPNFKKSFNIDFSYIYGDSIKNVIKLYIWRNYRENNLAISKLSYTLVCYKVFNNFAIKNSITTFEALTNKEIILFISYLKTYISPTTKKTLAYKSQKSYLDVLKAIIRWGQVYIPSKVPSNEIFTGSEFPGANRKLKIDFIPDEIVNQINVALKTEKNIYLKYGIIILQSTGMRIGDMLRLTTKALNPHPINGYTLTWYNYKKREEKEPMPIPSECVTAVMQLINHTKELRIQSEDINNYLFIKKIAHGKRKGDIVRIDEGTYNNWLKKLIKNNNILDSNKEFYNLTSHKFRRTLATDMYSKGIDLSIIQSVLDHEFSATTSKYYAEVKDNERAKVFKKIGIIGNINKVDGIFIEDKNELKWFKENKNAAAKMCDGYCTKPLNNGEICDRLLKRQKCYTCSRYITTPEYLDYHKNHLTELEEQLKNNIYGDHYAEHFIPTIEILKEIISRLEGLQNDNK